MNSTNNTMKLKILIPIFILLSLTLNAQCLKVSVDKGHLIYENGEPLIWTGDTAWELFHRCNREEVELSSKDRADKGFNIVQVVILAEPDGIRVPNSYGELPLIEVKSVKWNLESSNITPIVNHGIYDYEYRKAAESNKPLSQFLSDTATFLFEVQNKYYQKIVKAIHSTGYKGLIIT